MKSETCFLFMIFGALSIDAQVSVKSDSIGTKKSLADTLGNRTIQLFADGLSLAFKDTLTWGFDFKDFTPIEPMEIELTSNSIQIFHEINEHYTLERQVAMNDGTEGYCWFAKDYLGNSCRVYYYTDSKQSRCIAVEYHDAAWIYRIKAT